MGQADLAWFHHPAPADNADGRSGVMGIAERAFDYQRPAGRQEAGQAVYFCHFKGFLKSHVGQYAGQAAGQHGFTRTGASDHDDVVPPGCRHLQRPFGSLLAFYVGEVELFVFGGRCCQILQIGLKRADFVFPPQEAGQFG